MNRRQLLAALAAGAVVTAEGLWMPGTKLISIPRRCGNFGLSFGEIMREYMGDALRYYAPGAWRMWYDGDRLNHAWVSPEDIYVGG